MAIVTASNYSSPNVVKWASTDADVYDRLTQLAGWMENLDGHDHDSLKGVGVRRLQTASTPTSAGHVQVNTDDLAWWGSSAGAVQTAVRLAGSQTITGGKTFSGAGNSFSNGLTVSAGGFVISAGGANVTGNTVLNNNLTVSGTLNLPVFGGDTANSKSAAGLTLNQAANDDEILSLKSSDVSHGMTTDTEDDTYGVMVKTSGAVGGLSIRGYTESNTGLDLTGAMVTGDTTHTTTSVAAVHINGLKKSGTSTTSLASTENILVITDGALARFIFTGNGTSYEDTGTAWTNYDDHDDVTLLTDLSRAVSKPDDPIHAAYRDWADADRGKLQAMDLVHFGDDGHHFANRSRIQMLLIGAVRQQAARIDQLQAQFLALGAG